MNKENVFLKKALKEYNQTIQNTYDNFLKFVALGPKNKVIEEDIKTASELHTELHTKYGDDVIVLLALDIINHLRVASEQVIKELEY